MFSRLTIGRKVGAACLALVALSTAVAAVSLVSMQSVDGKVHSLASTALPGLTSISGLHAAVLDFRGNLWMHIASSDPDMKVQIERQNRALVQEMTTDIHNYETTLNRPEDRAQFAKVKEDVERYLNAWLQVLPVSRDGKTAPAYDLYIQNVEPVFEHLIESLDACVVSNRKLDDRAAANAENIVSRCRILICLLAAISLGAGTVLGLFIVRDVTSGMRRVTGELERAADRVASAADQISKGSHSASQAAARHAASLAGTVVSSAEMNSTARRNNEDSRSAAQLVTQSDREFELASASLREMAEAMNGIAGSSAKISNIIKVIDEIAFQTNILALNAAVEAARAGEAGMGFAVVADEVRTLARRCAGAAHDTTGLIADSISKSNTGQLRLDQVTASIAQLSGQMRNLKALVERVSSGSRDQTAGVEKIGGALAEMESVMQKVAANANEGEAAAEQLRVQSSALREAVSHLSAMAMG